MESVPFFRPSLDDNEISAVVDCLKSGWLTTGPKTAEFESAFASFVGGGVEAVAVNSATAALHLGLEALGVGPGDEVLLPTLTFTATAEVVRYLGAKPILVDIDLDTLCLSLEEVEQKISPATKVIMPVHFAGRMCDMSSLKAIAQKHGISILDDAAHALPAHHRNKSVGDCGADLTAFSFYANKTITTGEGGMLVTANSDLAARARIMRLHGIDRDVFNRFTKVGASWAYDVVAPGYKYNLTDIAASLGLVQLSRANDFHKIRKTRVKQYDEAFANLPLILPPHAAKNDMHSWHLYIVQIASNANVSRDEFIAKMQEKGIAISVHYRPLHQMTFWHQFAKGQNFPNAEKYFKRCVSLPLFMAMKDYEQQRVIEVVTNILTQ